MDTFFLIALVVLVAVGAALLLLSWGAYTGRTRRLWIPGMRPLVGGRYWFVLTPALLVGDVLVAIAMILVELNPETAGIFADRPGAPLPAGLVLAGAAILVLALVASYWLPERFKPAWIREIEAGHTRTDASWDRGPRRG